MPQVHRTAFATLAGLLLLAGLAAAAGVDEFYRGRNILLVIGYTASGTSEAYARLLGRHIGHHIPGDPVIITRQMTGAPRLHAANYIFSSAPRDGSVFAAFSHSVGVAPLFDEATFDSRKFTWLGSISDEQMLCVTWNTSAVRTWSDFITKPSTFGGEGPGADPDVWLMLYKNVFGAKAKLVSGYPGTRDIVAAMERGEVDGLCGISWTTIKANHPEWLSSHSVNFIVQAGAQKQLEIAAVPLLTDLTDDPQQLQIAKILLASEAMARPFAAPPGIPDDRKAALIGAFEETMQDANFLGEAKKLGFDVRPVSAAAIDALLAEIYAMPKDVVARAKSLLLSE
jgi:tripartite-type tricarboxylate transporter receptor subunit TctC